MKDPPLQPDRRCLYCLECVGTISGLHTRSIYLHGVLTAPCEATLYWLEDCSVYGDSWRVYGTVRLEETYDSL